MSPALDQMLFFPGKNITIIKQKECKLLDQDSAKK